jgi:hypothetical protein
MTDDTKKPEVGGGAFHGEVGDVGDVGRHLPSGADLDATEMEKKIAQATNQAIEISAKEQLVAALVRVGYREDEAGDLAAAAIAQAEERAAGAAGA